MSSVSTLEKMRCYSCRSCFLSCPKGVIEMVEDEEGFFYPEVNDGKCVECGICAARCPAMNPPVRENFTQTSRAVWLKDTEKLLQSSSGGLFAGLAERVLDDGGVVFGAAYDGDLKVGQTFVESKDDLWKLKGSKYVESGTGDSFRQAKEFLDGGRKVFYSGTPCQIAGLKKYLAREYENLLTADLICHGVPSQKLWRKYLEWQGEKLGEKIIYCGFRDKDVGGYSCNGKLKTKTKTKTVWSVLDSYYASFIRCETYRESCYSCPYSSLERPGDISMGDFTEIKEIDPNFDLTKGLSLCILNTEKGQNLFNIIKEEFNIIPLEFSQYISIKSNLERPSTRPDIRDCVYYDIEKPSVKRFFKRFKESSRFYFIKFYARKMICNILPRFVKNFIKRNFLRRI